MTKPVRLARIFKVLSVEARVRIIQLLKNRALCVGALSARLRLTQGAVSQHLRILRDAEVVIPEKRGYYVHYRLNEKTLAKWKRATEQFLSMDAERRPCVESNSPDEKGERLCPRKKRDVRGRRN